MRWEFDDLKNLNLLIIHIHEEVKLLEDKTLRQDMEEHNI